MSCCDHRVYVVEELMPGMESEFVGIPFSCANGAIGLAEAHADNIAEDATITVWGMSPDEPIEVAHQIRVENGERCR